MQKERLETTAPQDRRGTVVPMGFPDELEHQVEMDRLDQVVQPEKQVQQVEMDSREHMDRLDVKEQEEKG